MSGGICPPVGGDIVSQFPPTPPASGGAFVYWDPTLNQYIDVGLGTSLSVSGGVIVVTTPAGASWGNISGTLSAQTDLQAALDAKQNVFTTGNSTQYFRGDLSLASFPTDLGSFSNGPGYISAAGAPVQSVSNSDGSLTISPTSGAVVASLNLSHANDYSSGALQTFGNNISFGGEQLSVSGLASGDNLQYNGANWVNQPSGYSQMRFGSTSATLAGAPGFSTQTVTFATPFTGGGTPKVVGIVIDDGGNITTYQYNVWVYARSETNSGFTLVINRNFASGAGAGTYTFNYLAVK